MDFLNRPIDEPSTRGDLDPYRLCGPFHLHVRTRPGSHSGRQPGTHSAGVQGALGATESGRKSRPPSVRRLAPVTTTQHVLNKGLEVLSLRPHR